ALQIRPGLPAETYDRDCSQQNERHQEHLAEGSLAKRIPMTGVTSHSTLMCVGAPSMGIGRHRSTPAHQSGECRWPKSTGSARWDEGGVPCAGPNVARHTEDFALHSVYRRIPASRAETPYI